tara:strand:- start:327 stop:1097 length:771 start_codon:yes stop_codon:yes gene_type:complete
MDYKKQVQKRYKKLSKKQQIKLYEKMKDGDISARNILVESCLPMVIKIADKFSSNNKHIDFEDLVQEGNMAVVKAVNVFDPYKYGSITTLAWWAINNSLISMTHKSSYKMKHPFSVSSYASKMMKDIESSNSKDEEVIATKLNRKVKTIKNMKNNMYNRTGMFTTSVREKACKENDTPDHFCLAYLFEILDDEEVVVKKDSEIFKKYYGISDSHRRTSNELAEEYNVEPKQITDIIKRVRRDITLLVKDEKKRTHG